MQKNFPAFVLFIFFSISPSVQARNEAPGQGVEFEKTPTSLKQLLQGLPEEGVLFRENSYMPHPLMEKLDRTKIERRDDRLICTRDRYVIIESRDHYRHHRRVDVRAIDGTLIRRLSIGFDQDGNVKSRIKNTVQEDKVHIVTWAEDDDPQNHERQHERVPQDDQSIFRAWQPLARLYHLRQSHDDFQVRMRPWQHGGHKTGYNVWRWRQVGKETLAFDGQQVETRVFEISINSFDPQGKLVMQSKHPQRAWMTDAGMMVRRQWPSGDQVREVSAVTDQQAEQLIERFKAVDAEAK